MRLPPSVARLLVERPAVGRLVLRVSQTVVLGRARAVGMPETATCEDMLRSRRKREMVARAVYEELVGMEESERRIHGRPELTRPAAERFPGGYKEVEPLVEEACGGPLVEFPASGTTKLTGHSPGYPMAATLSRIRAELER